MIMLYIHQMIYGSDLDHPSWLWYFLLVCRKRPWCQNNKQSLESWGASAPAPPCTRWTEDNLRAACGCGIISVFPWRLCNSSQKVWKNKWQWTRFQSRTPRLGGGNIWSVKLNAAWAAHPLRFTPTPSSALLSDSEVIFGHTPAVTRRSGLLCAQQPSTLTASERRSGNIGRLELLRARTLDTAACTSMSTSCKTVFLKTPWIKT